ncbi:MAG: M81 family metallopeptidase [Firmicutes bacterium]|nr:M81 family metallopeptidase [Bacillota bacterium]
MKIVVGSLQQETNTFSPIKASWKDFDYVAGERVLSKVAVTDVFREAGAELIPTIYANAVPSGRLDKESFKKLCNELVEGIPAGKEIDGIWLYLHGAMEVEDIGSGEVALLSIIREKVGYKVPIAIALDFHANNSEEIVKYANIICGYKTAPHTDMAETQIRAAQLLLKCIREELLPQPVIVRIPLMITGDMVITECEPMKSIMEEAERIEGKQGILSVSVFNGQNWVDAPNVGASVIVIPESDKDMALKEAKRLGKMFWDCRKDFRFQVDAMEPEEAVDKALKASENLIFITDSGDNTTAGAAGDNTYLLKILLSKNAQNTLVGGITDSIAVKACEKHRVGDSIQLTIGARLAPEKSEPAQICGILKNKGNILGWDGEDGGKAVVLGVRGIDVIITENRCALISPEIFKSIGIDVFNYKVVVVKLGYLYPKLAKIAQMAILALTPGASCEAIEKLEFHNIKRPVYPLDTDFEWIP